MAPASSPAGFLVCSSPSFYFFFLCHRVVTCGTVTLLSLPAPMPFDWQLPGVKKLDSADPCFSHWVLPSTGSPARPSEALGGRGRGGASERQEEECRRVLWPPPWLPPQQLDFSQLCFPLLLQNVLWTNGPQGKRCLQTVDSLGAL